MFFFLQDAPQKSDNIHQAICFAILPFSFIQKFKYIAFGYREYFMESAGVRYLRTSC